jgi:glycosyltransferase involved in cell wall biosynthesis
MLKIALISCHASPLAVAGGFDCGGINLYLAQLGCELGASGCQVDIFTCRHRLEQPQTYLWRPNVRVIHVPAGLPGPAVFNAANRGSSPHCGHSAPNALSHEPPPYSEHFVDQFARAMVACARRQRGGYHIVHAHDLAAGGVARQVRRALGIPYVMTMHAGLEGPAHIGGAGSQQQPAASLLADADRIVALCRQQRQTMQTLCGAARDHIDIVPWGFDPAQLWPVRLHARAALALDSSAFVALQVARIAPGHGIDAALAGVAQLAAQHGVRARLLLVGAAAPCAGDRTDDQHAPSELARLRTLAQQLDVATTFAGPQPAAALRRWYSAADVYVATPRTTSFGVTALEAMACATPVVGTSVGGIASTVVDGQTGYLIPPDNPAALAERLAWLHAHPSQARSFGVQGWRRAHRHYTWRSVARRITAIYARVLAGVAADVAADIAADIAADHGAPPA